MNYVMEAVAVLAAIYLVYLVYTWDKQETK